MNSHSRELYDFGPFRLDTGQRLLIGRDHPIPLQPKAFETLLVLVRNSDKLVLKEDLLNSVWPDTFVEESNLAQNIFVLRKALRDVDASRRYILTVPGRGYQFVEPVHVVNATNGTSPSNGHAPAIASPSASGENLAPLAYPDSTAPAAKLPPDQARTTQWGRTVAVLLVAAAVGLAVGILLYRNFSRVPRVVGIAQITHSGRVDGWGRTRSDGSRLFFLERDGDHWNTTQVAVQGGDTQPFASGSRNTKILDISSRNPEMLIAPFVGRTGGLPLFAVPLVGGVPRRIGEINVDDAAISPDGTRFAYSSSNVIFLSDFSGTAAHRLAACGGECASLAWSPDAKTIRFTQFDLATNRRSLWQVSLVDGKIRPFLENWNGEGDVCCGRWTPDGKYFVFAATRDKQSNIWLLRESSGMFRSASRPFQLTHGPIGLYEPLPGNDGHTIFAQGSLERVVLERADIASRQVKPLLNSMPAWEIAYARTGQFAVYNTNDAVWKMDRNGGTSEKVFQNTAAMQVTHMALSNDGKNALLLGHPSGGADVVMLAPISGGSPRALAALGHPYIVPDFSPDGRQIVVGPDWQTANRFPEKTSLNIYTLDSGELQSVPDSHGLLGARWSPDGRYLAAFTADMRQMKLFDAAQQRWTNMTSGNYFSLPIWSTDSKWIYFQDLLDTGEPVFRIRPGDPTKERVFSFEDILSSGTQRCGFYGLTPDGAIVFRATRDGGDIFALDVDLP